MKRRPPLPKQGQVITVDYLNKLGACDIPDWLIREFPALEGQGITLNRRNLCRAARAAGRALADVTFSLGWVLLNRENVNGGHHLSREFRSLRRQMAFNDDPIAQAKVIADILGLR